MRRSAQVRVVEVVLAVFMTVAVLLMVMAFTRPFGSTQIRETSDLRRLAYNVLSTMGQSGVFENTLSDRVWATIDSKGVWAPTSQRIPDLELFLSMSLPPGLLYRMDIYLLNTSSSSPQVIYLGSASNYDASHVSLAEAEPVTYLYTVTGAKRLSYADTFSYTSLPAYISTLTKGSPNTQVFPSQGGLRTEVDALSDTQPGYSAAVYNFLSAFGLVPAAGFTFNVTGSYTKDSIDRQNNVAYVDVGVDTNWDGIVDTEYIFYRYDIATNEKGSILSLFVTPGTVICSVGSSGSCSTSNPSFKVYNLGPMISGANIWSSALPYTRGRILKVAFAVVDAAYAEGAGQSGDFWVDWKNFQASWGFEYIRGSPLLVQLTIGYSG